MFSFFKQKRMLPLAIFLALVIAFSIFFQPHFVFAGAPCSGGEACYDNKKCIDGVWTTEDCGSAVIGGVTAPEAVANMNLTSGIGLLTFFSKVLNFGAIVGGIIVVGNFVGAGLMYITGAGNADTHTKVKDKITYSVIGMIIIVSAYTIVGLMGLIFFKDPTFLLNPRLHGVL
ncbi:pilin [Patescibacteria group bacterium]|nr:pilin [Patescibacteria group bacterium]